MIDSVAIVESNLEIADGYRMMTLRLDREIEVRAGQFAMLRAHGAYEPLLRRALAIYRVSGPRHLAFLYQVLGRGTEMLSQLQPGGRVDALLPLGNDWLAAARKQVQPAGEENFISSIGFPAPAYVVAGGIGSASVLMLCQELQAANVPAEIFFGAGSQTVALGCGLDDFRELGLPLIVTTDDGSLGEKGYVTVPLEERLRETGRRGTVFACGPWGMMRRVSEIAAQFGLGCLVSLEAPMGCGFGVCVGCVVAVKTDGSSPYDSYKRVCIDGSIMPADHIRWEIAGMAH